jgi:hypothetical protein
VALLLIITALGERAIVAPELGGGFGVADLVIGTTLIDIKLAIEPTTDDIATWTRQLLGYVLLDRHDTFHIDAIAVYCGWQTRLVTHPLRPLLAAASDRPTAPDLTALRADFDAALRDELENYAGRIERERHR